MTKKCNAQLVLANPELCQLFQQLIFELAHIDGTTVRVKYLPSFVLNVTCHELDPFPAAFSACTLTLYSIFGCRCASNRDRSFEDDIRVKIFPSEVDSSTW